MILTTKWMINKGTTEKFAANSTQINQPKLYLITLWISIKVWTEKVEVQIQAKIKGTQYRVNFTGAYEHDWLMLSFNFRIILFGIPIFQYAILSWQITLRSKWSISIRP